MNDLSIRNFKYFAYLVVRDAIGFYLGIPPFLRSVNVDELVEAKLLNKLASKPQSSEKDIERYRKLITKSIQTRIKNLEEDYKHCQETLFTDSLWLQWLDLDKEFFKKYLDQLPPHIVDKLAVTPNWTIRDDDLSRPYLNSEKKQTHARAEHSFTRI